MTYVVHGFERTTSKRTKKNNIYDCGVVVVFSLSYLSRLGIQENKIVDYDTQKECMRYVAVCRAFQER